MSGLGGVAQTPRGTSARLVGGGVLGDGLGALRHGVLGQLTGEDEAHGGLNLAGGQGGLGIRKPASMALGFRV